jgi:hypothetical protein
MWLCRQGLPLRENIENQESRRLVSSALNLMNALQFDMNKSTNTIRHKDNSEKKSFDVYYFDNSQLAAVQFDKYITKCINSANYNSQVINSSNFNSTNTSRQYKGKKR